MSVESHTVKITKHQYYCNIYVVSCPFQSHVLLWVICAWAMHFHNTQTSALATGRSRGRRAGGELCSLSSLFLLPLPPVSCPASSPLPATSAKWQSREMLCSRALSQGERGKKGDICFTGGVGSRCLRQQRASWNEDSQRTNFIFFLLSCPFLPPTISGWMSSQGIRGHKERSLHVHLLPTHDYPKSYTVLQ